MTIENVPLRSIVEGVEVYLNISMVDWTSDLIVRLTSAEGMRVALAWIGEITEGNWVLECSEHSASAVGTLNSWQLRITYDDLVTTEVHSWTQVKAMYR